MFIYPLLDWFAPNYYFVSYELFGIPTFWLCAFLLVPVANVVFDATVRFVRLQLCGTPVDAVIERERLHWAIPA